MLILYIIKMTKLDRVKHVRCQSLTVIMIGTILMTFIKFCKKTHTRVTRIGRHNIHIRVSSVIYEGKIGNKFRKYVY